MTIKTTATFPKEEGIYRALNKDYLIEDNEKYMNMYNRISYFYDFGEHWIGSLLFGSSLAQLRTELMKELEWENNLSVLYVSIGTGYNLRYIPKNIDLQTLDFVGVDISLGMLKKCQKKMSSKTHLQLFHACAEELPFADNSFDIVYHIGGINFFTDKQKALSEMLRVAKPGVKILIADETSDYIEKQYKKSRITKKYFTDAQFDLQEIEQAIPKTVQEKETKLLRDNKFYSITFRKPLISDL
ncbi:MAG: methyltransferase domain-containing protein [Streptococcus sp.]|nr:methyltransferase domain-containing protein [Streptococcus sp.]